MTNSAILIVEDEAIIAEDLALKVRRLGYNVAGTTATGEEAVEIAVQRMPALVLMDIHLAGAMDGIEAARQIYHQCKLPVLFLTAHSDIGSIERAQQANAFGYILKPFSERDLRIQIEMALYRHEAERRLSESEERYRVLAETMLQGVVHIDASGKIIAMNPAAEHILGRNLEQLLGICSVTEELHTIHDNGEPFPDSEHPSLVALRTGLPVRGVIMGVFDPNLGDHRWISIDAVPVFSQSGLRPVEVFAVFEDVTDREIYKKNLEELVVKRTGDLIVAKEEAERRKEIAEDRLSEIKSLQAQLETEKAYLQEEIKLEHNHTKIIGQSDALKYVPESVKPRTRPLLSILGGTIFGFNGAGSPSVCSTSRLYRRFVH